MGSWHLRHPAPCVLDSYAAAKNEREMMLDPKGSKQCLGISTSINTLYVNAFHHERK